MTTGKTIALTRQTVVDKVISLVFNMLSRLVITRLVISLEGMMLKLKLQYFGHLSEELTHWKRL